MKNKFAALIMATFVATPVMAQNVDNQVFANQNVKAIELSQTEMKETQGNYWKLQAVGAAIGGYSAYKAGDARPKDVSIGSAAWAGAQNPISTIQSFANCACWYR